MSCTDCTECREVTPPIPRCLEEFSTVDLGDTSLLGVPVIIRIRKISSNVTTEFLTTTGPSGAVTFQLSDFDVDASFWQANVGFYRLEIVARADNEVATISQGAGGLTAECVLLTIAPISPNFAGAITLTW